MWLTQKLKNFFTKKPRNNFSETRLDRLDNQYRRAQFQKKAAGGLNGQLSQRIANFTNPKPLDEE
jgi:hypothetical protein